MPVFAANLSLMFTEWSFLDRFAAAADAGFTAVEFLFPHEFSPEDIGRRLQDNQLNRVQVEVCSLRHLDGRGGFPSDHP
jgi:hydroxypyruvate isomerase